MELSKEEKEAMNNIEKTIEYVFKCNDDEEVTVDCYDAGTFQKVLNLISKLQKENEKQSKVIDEMINHIEHTCYYQDDYGNSCDVIQDTCINRDKDCKECIKQYFYGKVENENV